MVFEFKDKQFLQTDIKTAWKYFSNPKNLPEITPDWLNFRIKSDIPENMHEGLIIKYKVSPLLNISSNWITEITHVKEPYFFVDEQIKGPYKMWIHQHTFEEKNGGIEMTDTVYYEIPFNFIGNILNSLLIKKKVKEIFNYRRAVLKKKFK